MADEGFPKAELSKVSATYKVKTAKTKFNTVLHTCNAKTEKYDFVRIGPHILGI